MPESAAFCPGCGLPVQIEPQPREKPPFRRENLLGAVAYFTFLPALVLLLVERYRRNSFVRFHSVQCLLFWLVSLVTALAVRLLVLVLLFVPIAGPLLAVLFVTIAGLAALFLWIVLVVKAFQGEKFTLPLIGGLAEQYSNVS